MSHTPEPWLVRNWRILPVNYVLTGAPIATVHARKNHEMQTANARRIVACVNACKGVDTDLLEQNPAPFSELRAERDVLLKALTGLVANQDANWELEGFTNEQIKVMPYLKASREAIAKAGGAA